jgi:hypothetical protein
MNPDHVYVVIKPWSGMTGIYLDLPSALSDAYGFMAQRTEYRWDLDKHVEEPDVTVWRPDRERQSSLRIQKWPLHTCQRDAPLYESAV